MEFSNLYFLYVLLPLTLVIYFAVRDVRRKNIVLAAASLLLYAMGQPVYLLLMVGLSYLNFGFALRIRPKKRRSLLLPVAVNVAVLVLCKHVDFLLGILGIGAESGGLLLGLMRGIVTGLNRIGMSLTEPERILPVGLSVYVLSVISYLVDVYQGRVKAERSFLNLLVYLTMFPKLANGPIVRYEAVAQQLTARKTQPRMAFEGLLRFAIGLGKKVLLADYCAKLIGTMAGGPDQTLVGAWLCALLYFFRIYFDFSGYCDMAVGLGKIFGFRYCENFDLPYTAVSINEFCRRWNKSLVRFFKDYVYIPLGGSRMGSARQLVNLLAVWLMVGLWHGGSWNYLIWALYFFTLQAAEKLLESQLADLPKGLRRFLTMLAVIFGWVIFAHEDTAELAAALKGMLGFGGFATDGLGYTVMNSLPLIGVCALGCSSLPRKAGRFWTNLCAMNPRQRKNDTVTLQRVVYLASAFGLICWILWQCTASLTAFGGAPSIYGNL